MQQPMLCSLFVLSVMSFCNHFLAAHEFIYFEDFEESVGHEWSSSKTSITPVGHRRFLGEFANDTVTLTLGNLPAHSEVTVSFDLFIIRSWDGNTEGIDGPDIWQLKAMRTDVLLRTTFCNHDLLEYSEHRQSYPDAYPAEHPPRTGAAETDTLGYTWRYLRAGERPADSVYHLSFDFNHSAETLTLEFSASGLGPITNESWGLDNVRIEAKSEDERMVLYVDDDAPNDPGPYDATVSDLEADGSKEHPYDTIQKGIDAAKDGDTVIVREGTYYETIEFQGKRIEVTSFDPEGDGMHTYPVIDAGYVGTVVTFAQGEDLDSKLSGFVLTGGLGTPVAGAGGAITCTGASPHISNCVIVGNRCTDLQDGNDPLGAGAIYCVNSSAIFENCTIADNYAGVYGAGVYLLASDVTISNSIIWGNMPEQIVAGAGDASIVCYTNVLGGWPGLGNTDVEPGFAFPGYWADRNDPGIALMANHPDATWLDGDYHLMSRSGRWDPFEQAWTMDQWHSPCIDAGDLDSSWENEPAPNGGRVNLGAYGGTPQTSMSTDPYCLTISATEGGRVVEPGIVEPGETKTFCFDWGETITIVVEPDANHHFGGWPPELGGIIDANDPDGTTMIITVDSDLSYAPQFPPNNLQTEITPGGSIEYPDGIPSTFNRHVPVRIVAEPDPCYYFTHWSGTAVEAGKVADAHAADTTVMVDGGYTLIANFTVYTPTLTISSAGGGSVVVPGEGAFTFDCGTLAHVQAVPEDYYRFSHWSGTAVDEGKVDNVADPNTTVTMDTDCTLQAYFAPVQYTLSLSSTDGGSVAVPGEGDRQYVHGTSVPVEARADERYQFTGWTGTAVDAGKVGTVTDPNTTVTIDADYSLIANFALIEYCLDIASTAGGSVTTPGDGAFWYDCGEVVCLTVEADPDYQFVRWEGSAVDAGKVAPHETDPDVCVTMDGSYTLTAVFESNCAPRYDFPMDANPGWSLEGQWAFGAPTGQRCGAWGNNDPIGGYTGHNVLGVNLDGCYEAKIGGPYYATAGPFDLSEYENVTLRFWRWLNCDIPEYVKSTVEVSTDGLNWIVLWTQGERQEITDTQWTLIEYPLPQADGQAAVYLRWGYEVIRERAYAYTGWNIDDVQLIGCVNGDR